MYRIINTVAISSVTKPVAKFGVGLRQSEDKIVPVDGVIHDAGHRLHED